MKKLLLIFVMMATWIVVSCATTQVNKNEGCWGFWKSNGPKRGTLEKNKFNTTPYRQCVDEIPPHKDLERRPYG